MWCQTILISDELSKDTITKNVSVKSVRANWVAPSLFDAVVNYLTPISKKIVTTYGDGRSSDQIV